MRLRDAKQVVGPCPSKAVCITHGKLPSEQPPLAGRRQPVSCLYGPGPSQKVRQMAAAPGKSAGPPPSAICRAAAGPASGSDTCVSSLGGPQDRDSAWDLTTQRDQHPSSIRGKAGAQREAAARGDFLPSPGQGSRETHGTGTRSLGPSSPEPPLWDCRAPGRQQRLGRAPDLCQLPAASFLLQQRAARGGDAEQ